MTINLKHLEKKNKMIILRNRDKIQLEAMVKNNSYQNVNISAQFRNKN